MSKLLKILSISCLSLLMGVMTIVPASAETTQEDLKTQLEAEGYVVEFVDSLDISEPKNEEQIYYESNTPNDARSFLRSATRPTYKEIVVIIVSTVVATIVNGVIKIVSWAANLFGAQVVDKAIKAAYTEVKRLPNGKACNMGFDAYGNPQGGVICWSAGGGTGGGSW